jgi:DMSO reductase anchor subunit
MNPAWSVIVFTTVAGAAQGLVAVLATALIAGIEIHAPFARLALVIAFAMLAVGLAASFFHLGRPERAWRAAAMWRTSWLSREVIALPGFMGLVALWWLCWGAGVRPFVTSALLPAMALVSAVLLWYCTAMIYACLRFIEEWSHPLTFVNFALIGVSSGALLAAALAATRGFHPLLGAAGPLALVATLAACATRIAALHRNAAIRHRSTLQSATGIAAAKLVQTSMGMSAGSFNTREFFHHASAAALKRIRWASFGLGFALPALLAVVGLYTAAAWPWWCAVIVQIPGLFADRWFFFAQAKHPQNLYYQTVS